MIIKLQFKSVLMSVVLLIMLNYANTQAEKPNIKKYAVPDNQIIGNLIPGNIENTSNLKNTNYPRLQDANFQLMDSLANSYSYLYIMSNRSFIYDRSSDVFMTIKRGALQSDAQGKNKTYNLFLRTTSDRGVTWEGPTIVYDKDALSYYDARYPSLYGFKLNGVQQVAATFPIIDYSNPSDATWLGYITELWNPLITDVLDIPMNVNDNETLVIDGTSFNWSNESRVVAGRQQGDETAYFIASVGEVSPDDSTDYGNASAIALRWTSNVVDEIFTTIPPAWSSSKFTAVDRGGSRYNQLIDLRRTNDGTLYLAVYGNFYSTLPAAQNPNRVGFSESLDDGANWGDFVIMPIGLDISYLESQGLAGGTIILGRYSLWNTTFYSSKGFVAFDNGDVSFIVTVLLYDTAQQYVKSQVVEIYYENGNWGIRKIADLTPRIFTYRDMTMTGQPTQWLSASDNELQISSTSDGSVLVAKWMDFTNYNEANDTYGTTDIFIATRNKNSNVWGDTLNITKSTEIDRITLMPDYLPNDLTDIPILKLYTMTKPGDSELDSQFVAGHEQYLLAGHFNAPVDVDENTYNDSDIEMEVIPNPVTDAGRIKVYYEGKPVHSEIIISDMLGREIAILNGKEIGYGTSFFDFSTSGLSSGAYYCTLSIKDKKLTKMMNVIK